MNRYVNPPCKSSLATSCAKSEMASSCGEGKGSKHFPRDQRLKLETSGWEVLDYEGNVMSHAEVER